ncbi:unnamed protein product [Linum trigynum]|uniref:Reverse transcriptase Ty1/copia-type domain-containing protein n=1 Tax=Linum trigynum TaxID=586398 RepID=A0AAV2CYS9_9ROSI
MDVSNAFLHGDLEEVYMEVPDGLKGLSYLEGTVLKLNNSLYGLKQVTRQWFIKLSEYLKHMGFEQSLDDYSVFKMLSVVLIVYVDDIMLAGPVLGEIERVKQELKKGFKVKDLGNMRYFMGLEVARSIEGISQ